MCISIKKQIPFAYRKHKLSWCPVYKAGSSTWLYNFALLGGHTDEQINNSKLQLSHYVRNIFPPLTSWEAIRVLYVVIKKKKKTNSVSPFN